jgi:molecular chaperone HscB
MDVSERIGATPRAQERAALSDVVACWSCRGPVEAAALFCPTCAAVQPPGQADHFVRLGLPVDYAVDTTLLDRRYFERQRLLHPDRFVTRAPRERALSQQQATAINSAYETLKDPVRRADYLLQLAQDRGNPDCCNMVNDPELLAEAMEMREALADASSPEEIGSLESEAAAGIDVCVAELADAFAGDDLATALYLTTRLKYLRKLVDDCRARRLHLAAPRD